MTDSSQTTHVRNSFACISLIYGLIFAGFEILSTGLKFYGHGQRHFISLIITMAASSAYIITGLNLITKPTFLSVSRFAKLLPLITAFIALNLIKFFDTNAMLDNWHDANAWANFFAEVIPGSGKRSILIYGLLNDWQVFRPFETTSTKSKKE